MARAHYVKKAAKDNPVAKKGEPYWWWQFYRGPKQYSKTQPRPSQLTGSETLSAALEVQERCEDLEWNVTKWADLETTIKSELEEIAGAAREAGEGLNEKADNLDEHFEGSEEAETAREHGEAMEQAADTLDDAAARCDREDAKEQDMNLADWLDGIRQDVEGIDWPC